MIITTAVNQLISILRTGQPVGGKYEDSGEITTYLYREGVFYVADKEVTEEDLRARLIGHFHSLGEEELDRDVANIEAMYERLQVQAVRNAEALPALGMVEPSLEVCAGVGGVHLTSEECYDLLHLVEDEDYFLNGENMERVRAVLRKLYEALPRHQQKDIEELDVYPECLE